MKTEPQNMLAIEFEDDEKVIIQVLRFHQNIHLIRFRINGQPAGTIHPRTLLAIPDKIIENDPAASIRHEKDG